MGELERDIQRILATRGHAPPINFTHSITYQAGDTVKVGRLILEYFPRPLRWTKRYPRLVKALRDLRLLKMPIIRQGPLDVKMVELCDNGELVISFERELWICKEPAP